LNLTPDDLNKLSEKTEFNKAKFLH